MLWGVRQSYRRLVYKYVSDNTEVCLPTLKAGRFHMFLSHQQQHGQDQVEVIKYRLETLVPGIRLFIDTDLSNTGRGLQNVLELKNFVKESELVVYSSSQAVISYIHWQCMICRPTRMCPQNPLAVCDL